MILRDRITENLKRCESHRRAQKRAWDLKLLIGSVLVLPLVLAAVMPPAASDSGYHAVAKRQTLAIPPGERFDDEFGMTPRLWLATSLRLDHASDPVSALAEIRSYRNTFRLFYTLVPLREWTGVFVI
jgi:hypothetical protein